MNSPIFDRLVRDFAGREARAMFADLRAVIGIDTPRCPDCGTLLRDGSTTRGCPICPTPPSPRLAILNGSALMYARTAGA